MTQREPETVFPYRNVRGELRYEVLRLPGKDFRIRRPNGDGTYSWNLDGISRIPYRLEEVFVADEVFLVEREKDCETLRGLDIVASTNPGGASGWRSEFAEHFKSKRVIVLPDQDVPGYKWAANALKSLFTVASQVKRVDLPGLEFGSGGDVSDWLNAGHTKHELLQLVESAPLWEPTDSRGETLLQAVEDFVRRFVILPEDSSLPIAAWVLATHTYKSFEAFPYVCIISPTKGCGKTRSTEVLSLLTANAYRTVNISEAALFRLIEEHEPTLILDEAEALTGKSDRAEAIRALLNAGNRRNTTVPRCVGTGHELKLFTIYCPKVIVAIGTCPDTIRDRSILLLMQKKKPGEVVGRFLPRRVGPEAEGLRKELAAFISRHKTEVEQAYESLDLDFLEDRDAEAWEPLFAVLKVADPSRWDELRRCAIKLTTEKAERDVDESFGLRLLTDLNTIWPEGQSAIFTADVIQSLKGIEDSPWANEVELTPRKLARLLRPFCVEPKQVRVEDRTAKGYDRTELEVAFSRYLAAKRKHAKQPA